jgi:hypothetical protein
MTKVVAKPSKLDASYMLVLDTQGRLTLLKMLSHHPGQVTNACPRKIPSAELSAQMDQRSHQGSAQTYCETRRETHSTKFLAALHISTVENEDCGW